MLINYDSKSTIFGKKLADGLIQSDVRESLSIFDQTINLNNITITDQICVVESAISAEMCKHIIQTVESVTRWEKAITVGEGLGSVSKENSPRQNDILMISALPELKVLDDFLHKLYSKCLSEYLGRTSKLTITGAGLTIDEGYQVLRYAPGGYYKTHIDYSSIKGNHGGDTVRVVTGLIYLTDDHGGGEVNFPAQGIKIKPKAGSVIFFPSIYTHPHAGCEVTSGTKYNIVTWWK